MEPASFKLPREGREGLLKISIIGEKSDSVIRGFPGLES